MRTIAAVATVAATLAVPATLDAQEEAPVDLRVGVFTTSAKRNSALGAVTLPQSSEGVRAVEARLGTPGGTAGIHGRLMRAGFVEGDFEHRELGIYLGDRGLNLEGAYVERLTPGDTTRTFARAGIRSHVRIGGTGVSAVFAGSGYFPIKKGAEGERGLRGWEGETGLLYIVPRFPVFLQAGYRFAHFSVGEHSEELSGITLGGGIWIGGR